MVSSEEEKLFNDKANATLQFYALEKSWHLSIARNGAGKGRW